MLNRQVYLWVQLADVVALLTEVEQLKEVKISQEALNERGRTLRDP